MDLGRRDPSQLHSTAGVDASSWHEFAQGQRVMTVEGFLGTIDAIEDGPHAGAESYRVTLDAGMGGGSYSAGELTSASESQMYSVAALEEHECSLHTAADDYPELGTILSERPPLEHAIPVSFAMTASKTAGWQVVDQDGNIYGGPFENRYRADDELKALHQAGEAETLYVERVPNDDYAMQASRQAGVMDLLDTVVDEFADRTGFEPGRNKSFDWCRFRRDQHCWYPKELNHEATREAGYTVWVPEDRGYCPRNKWDEQRACPVGEPGPKSGDPMGRLDATIPWEEGGQRVSIRSTAGASDSELQWHFTAGWTDIQDKAKQIRSKGHVRIISAQPGYITAEVRGDSNIYQTTIMRVPGKKSVAMWECGCAWANYSWACSGRWKKYEGRMCSHALAVTYEAQAHEFGGNEVREEMGRPTWRNDPTLPVVVPGDSRTKPQQWRVGSKTAALPPIGPDPTISEVADWYHDLARANESKISRDIRAVVEHEAGALEGFNFRIKDLDSLERKITDKSSRGGDPRSWIKDALRYTMVFHPAIFSDAVQDSLLNLEDRGYVIEEEENSWMRGDSYSALHYTLRSRDGVPIELQFHTDESYILKDKTLHKIYEEFRKSNTPLARRQYLWDVMTKYWDEVDIPDDALEFPGEKHYLRPAASINPLPVSDDPSLAIPPALAMQKEADLVAQVKGLIRKIKSLVGRDQVRLDNDEIVPAKDVLHPKYHPSRGIADYRGSKTAGQEYTVAASSGGTHFHVMGDSAAWCGTTVNGESEQMSYMSALAQVTCPRCLSKLRSKTAAQRDTPATEYGLLLDAALLHHPEVVAAKAFTDWDSIPVQSISTSSLYATETMLASSSIDKVVSGREPLREGYDAYVVKLADGRHVVIDGHHRAAMATAMGRDLDAHVLDATKVGARRASIIRSLAQANTTGVMVALRPSDEVCNALLDALDVDGTPETFDNLHITVAYIGDTSDVDKARLDRVVAAFAMGAEPLVGRAGGLAIFDNDEKVLVSLYDIPGLDEWRERLVDYLEDAGIEVSKTHGFTPHLTLMYASEGADLGLPDGLPAEAKGEQTFGDFIVAYGGDWEFYDMGQPDVMRTEKVAVAEVTDAEYDEVLAAAYSYIRDAFPYGTKQWHAAMSYRENLLDCFPEPIAGTTIEEVAAVCIRYGWDRPTEDGEYSKYPEAPRHTAHLFEASAEDMLSDMIYAEPYEGVQATLHDEPEPALPSTDGVAEEPEILREDPPAQVHRTEASASATTAPEWLNPMASSGGGRGGDPEIAGMAARFLKEGMRAFSPAEQQAFINEGQGTTASNLDRLDIAGTHYEAMDALQADDDEGLFY